LTVKDALPDPYELFAMRGGNNDEVAVKMTRVKGDERD
jgi:hypothetical protein